MIAGFSEDDDESLVRYLNDPAIQSNTLMIPYPYALEDARNWIRFCHAHDRDKLPLQFAIRHNSSGLIGGIGFGNPAHPNPYKKEIGYWLATRYSGQHIMTRCVRKICEYGFNKLLLRRIEAFVFPGNPASKKVLESNGFTKEGLLRNYHFKDGNFQDAEIYAKLY